LEGWRVGGLAGWRAGWIEAGRLAAEIQGGGKAGGRRKQKNARVEGMPDAGRQVRGRQAAEMGTVRQ
jgi:hypothetical protein